jgi:hypothetical protein
MTAEIVYRQIDQARVMPGLRPCSRCGALIFTEGLYRRENVADWARVMTCRLCIGAIAARRRMVVRDEATRLVLVPATPS